MTKEYSEKDIKQLTDLEHARIRPTIYVGDTNPTKIKLPKVINNDLEFIEYTVSLGYVVCIREIIDNCIDIIRHTGKGSTVSIQYFPEIGNSKKKAHKFIVADDSVGVPIGLHESGKYTPEVVFSSLRSGKNFETDEFIIGMNGMGASLTNFFSKIFEISIARDEKHYRQAWFNAVPDKPLIQNYKGKTGTSVGFQLDEKYFHGWQPTEEFIEHFIQILAALNTDIKFKYNKRRVYTKGLRDFAVNGTFYKKDKNWEFILLPTEDGEYNPFSAVNGVPTLFGGRHLDHVEWLLTETVKKSIRDNVVIHKSNILKGLTVMLSLKDVPNIQFDTQAKTRLITEDLAEKVKLLDWAVRRFVKNEGVDWIAYIREQFERKKVWKQIAKKKNGKKRNYYHAKAKADREVYIVEGLSALANLLPVRHDNQGCIPLRGKIVNASMKSLSDVVKSDTVYSLIDMLGIELGGQIAKCNYDRIILATDADPDGLHIQSLLINLFHHLAPDLLDRLYILQSPLYVVEKGKYYEVYFDKESFKKASIPAGADIRYNKGLGSLTMKEWEVMVDPQRRRLLQAVPLGDKKEAKTFKRLFAWDSSYRKKWLQGKDKIYNV